MKVFDSSFRSDNSVPTPECLLDRVKEVRGYLRNNGFSAHAIDHAITVLYRAAIPYLNGTKTCDLKNRRAWVFKVAIRAAVRAAKREVRFKVVKPNVLAATVMQPKSDEAPFDLSDALKRLTKKQSDAVELCILRGMSRREAAKDMGIAVSTLCGHLSAAKEHLKEILPPLLTSSSSRRYDPSAPAS